MSFQLLNIDQREHAGIGGKFRENAADDSFSSAISYLVKPTGYKIRPLNLMTESHQLSYDRRKKKKLNSDPLPFRNTLGRLEEFPDEILCIIFNNIDALEDIIRFGLGSRYLYDIAYDVIHRRYVDCLSSWAGCRLICLGGYTNFDDLPPEVFTLDEIDNIQRHHDMDVNDEVGMDPYRYFTTNRQTLVPSKPFIPKEFFHELLSPSESNVSSEYLERLYRHFEELRFSDDTLTYTTDQPWVLCNLSKNEYIRMDAVDNFYDCDERNPLAQTCSVFSTIAVLLPRICWISNGGKGIEGCCNEYYRGSWAGDCFEITTLNRLRPAKEESDWVDVTNDAINDTVKLWESLYGSLWRNML
ncbi:unnamed protein product [Somion occarium]|uniref:F-box domain-containing protein n=1 Tax=Somion occarium TaxID=3059160 RepID=A0ABP1CQN3_9APHY